MKSLLYKSLYNLGLISGFNRSFLSAICYHSISNTSDLYSINLSTFKEQIELINHSAKFIDPKQLENIINGKQIKDWGVILTIDDGYKDVERIIPLIKKINIPVVLFVLSNSNFPNRKELANNHKLLTIRKIKKLHKLGWTIGCHSATHADLSKSNDKQLEHEIINSKKTLEKKLGFKINYFAYPKGIVNKRILKFVEKAGYKLAFTTQPGTISSNTNRLLIPRTVITKSRQLTDFPYFLSETALFLQQSIEKLGLWRTLAWFK